MANFTVRVVLYEAEWKHYDKLYENMEKEGFTDEITDSSGTTYELPDGEYNITSTLDKSDILAMAKKAARSTGKDYSILVTMSNGRTWFNLKKV